MSRNFKRSILTLIAGLLFAGAAIAQDDGTIAALKAESGFSSWPGTGGALKQGLPFKPSDYPALVGFSVSGDKLKLGFRDFGIIRAVMLTNGSAVVSLTIGVGTGSVINGHELFLRADATNRDLDYFQAYVRGDPSIAIGDLNFTAPNAVPGAVGPFFAFLRNNVFCIIADNPGVPSGINLATLATQLDNAILGLPDLSVPDFESKRPVINSFSPASTVLSASAGDSTTVAVSVSDPTGNSGPLTRQFDDGGELDVTDVGGPTVTVAATSTTGSVPLTLVAINVFLQFASNTQTFTVTP
jgi:hypothetical protein